MNPSLDERLQQFTDESPDSSFVFSQQPVKRLLHRRTFRLLLLCIAAAFGSHTWLFVLRLTTDGVQAFTHFKLEILELRDGTLCPGSGERCKAVASGGASDKVVNVPISPAVWRFGMLLCQGSIGTSLCHDAALEASTCQTIDMNLRTQSQQWREGALIISFDVPVPSNGFFLVAHTPNATWSDPVRFAVYATNAPESAWHACIHSNHSRPPVVSHTASVWTQVGSSTRRFDRRAHPARAAARNSLFENGYYSTASPGGVHIFDNRPAWLPTFITIVITLLSSGGLIGTCMAAEYGYHELAATLVGLTMSVFLTLSLILLWCSKFNSSQSFHMVCLSIMSADWKSSQMRRPFLFWSGFPILAVSGAWAQTPLMFFVGVTGSLYLILAFLGYRESVAKSNNIVRPDMLAYLASWQALTDEASSLMSRRSSSSLLSLCVSLVSDIQCSIDARQHEWLGVGGQGRKVHHVIVLPTLTNTAGKQEESIDVEGGTRYVRPVTQVGPVAQVAPRSQIVALRSQVAALRCEQHPLLLQGPYALVESLDFAYFQVCSEKGLFHVGKATHCHALRHTATHCNTLQHAATRCNTLQHTASPEVK